MISTMLNELVHTTAGESYLTRTVHSGGHVIRVRIRRARLPYDSYAVGEVIARDGSRWTRLVEEHAHDYDGNWFRTVAPTDPDHPATLAPLADRLTDRAVEIVTACPTAADGWSDMDIIRALLGRGADEYLDPGIIAEANTDPDTSPVHILRLPDGKVVITTSHLPGCAYVTSAGQATCDNDACYGH
ncbi:hypothetical protein [Actinokineospora sp. HUAS TT18]|uniref:hypothetical protein n=1 Tax=Actinokineospora sp. HUAS TT18 TaxID=3447451 RepID=UPI003F523C71